MQHSFDLYGRRNRIFLPGILNRIVFLNLAIGDLQDAIRKGVNDETLGTALARVVSRIFCIAEHFQNLPFVEVLARKYPASRCSYCGKIPCCCPERRLESQIAASPDPSQLTWNLSDWTQHLDQLYGERNRHKGIENVINRLFKEISELLSLSMEIATTPSPRTHNEIEEEFALELSDALAWTIATANILRIDLEAAFLDRYGNGCRTCKSSPCQCTNFAVTPVRWVSV
ncbi:MAG TPA: hypothetical protein VNK70_00100 [Candidatus Paceibacterota bacterium]|nr:hypothetical protein [Candidatus Paceibacterota bacterium]